MTPRQRIERLRHLAGSAKCPKPIAEDLMRVLMLLDEWEKALRTLQQTQGVTLPAWNAEYIASTFVHDTADAALDLLDKEDK